MKAFLVLALVAAAYAAPPVVPTTFGGIGPKSITINPDGSILVSVNNGAKQVVISKNVAPDGTPEVDVSVSGPFINPEWFQFADVPSPKENSVAPTEVIDYLRAKRVPVSKTKTKSQTDVLNSILKDFTGPLDEPTYQKLLTKLNKSVLKGEISPAIYQVFQTLDQPTSTTPDQTTQPSLWSQFISGPAGSNTPIGQVAGGQSDFIATLNTTGGAPWIVTKSAFLDYLRQQIAQQQLQQLVQQVLTEAQKNQQPFATQQPFGTQQPYGVQPYGVQQPYGYGYPSYPGYYPAYPYYGQQQVSTSDDTSSNTGSNPTVGQTTVPVQRQALVQSGYPFVPQQRFTGYPYQPYYAPNYPVGQY